MARVSLELHEFCPGAPKHTTELRMEGLMIVPANLHEKSQFRLRRNMNLVIPLRGGFRLHWVRETGTGTEYAACLVYFFFFLPVRYTAAHLECHSQEEGESAAKR